jgi:predicted O-methyltransferase YrrM
VALKRLLRRVVLALAQTPAARRLIASVIVDEPSLAVRPMRMATSSRSRFTCVDEWPQRLDGFEDLAFLFTSSPLNMGIVSMTIAEAAYLYRLVTDLPEGAHVVEIGRYQGGSTFVIASALPSGGTLVSYDTHVNRTADYTGAEMDHALREALRRYGCADRVQLLVEDSTGAAGGSSDLIFVDGDHTYAGVRADYDHWSDRVKPGGHLLFHDAVLRGELSSGEADSARLVAEIARDDADRFESLSGADSLAHFRRRG